MKNEVNKLLEKRIKLIRTIRGNPDPSKMYKELEQLDKQIERVRKDERDSERKVFGAYSIGEAKQMRVRLEY